MEITMNPKLKRIDGRMRGFQHFTHFVDYDYVTDGDRKFIEARIWATETFGPTVELDAWRKFSEFRNPRWSWERQEYGRRIFLNGDAISIFSLRWL
jgi:hypothetical protein